ncbi:hypothetical protein V494_06061 [Pseudogymnoascus sp. VKM F-4513 (FW-928)]|nr:hypothetical protein V494_06061 [Pseudogymnoascus sp. VKM F-4513 (FW-928)]
MSNSKSQGNGVRVSTTIKTKEGHEDEVRSSQVTSPVRFSVIQNATKKSIAAYRTELGSSAERFFTSCQSVEAFFDAVARIRLHQMPHDSSRWDKVLKWAEFFAGQVQGYSEELGPKYISVLEKAFRIFYSCGITLRFFLRHNELFQSSEELQATLAESLTVLLSLVTSINIEYTQKQKCTRLNERSFDERFGRTTDSFFSYADRFTNTIWATHLQSLAKTSDISVDSVRDFLVPHDTVTRSLAVTRFIRKERADYTCEWFSQYLTDFTKSDKSVLFVTGEPATGKTVLSEWAVERLQSLDGQLASDVITYRIDPDLKTEHTSLSVVKGLLLQILQLSAGGNELYKSLANAYELFVRGNANSEVETALWKALEGGLRSDRNQTIVIDGIDILSGGEADSLGLLEQLNSVVSKKSKTKSVVFSRPLASSIPKNFARVSIKPEQTAQDMHYVAEHSLLTTPNFEGLNDKNRASLTSSLANKATGSFGWLLQALEILKKEKTPESILKKAESLPTTWSELLDVTIGAIDLSNRDTKSTLALLLAAERPLLIGEFRQLMELDISTCTRVPRLTKAEDDAVSSLGQLIDIRDGFVRFRHSTIKENLLHRARSVKDFKNSSVFPFHLKEAHYDLTLRCMAYIKINVSRYTQPTLEPLNHYELGELFNSFEALQYSARYWTSHFKASPMHNTATSHKITANFKTCFPDSTLLAAIEGSCYQFQFPAAKALYNHLLALSIRTNIIGGTSEPVLQTLLNVARTKQVTLESAEVNEYYHVAWKLAVALDLTTIATACSNRYLEMTSSVTASKSSEITKCRIEMLEYMVTTQRETTINVAYLEQLATIYTTIGETEKAAEYYQEIYNLNVRIYGRTSEETRRSYQKLTSTVQKSTKTEEINEITRNDYDEAVHTLPATDPKRISLTWSMVEFYEKKKDTRRLEETLLTLWQSLTRVSKDSKSQERKFDVALRYAELLKDQKRTREAENILRTIWIDLEHETESDKTINRTKIIGDQLRSVGAVDTASLIYSRLWAYYVKTGKQSSSEASSVSSSLKQVNKEKTSETNGLTTLTETFQVSFANSTTKSITTTTVQNAVTLVDSYYQQKNWDEVIKIGTIAIGELWPAFNQTEEFTTPLPTTYYQETMEIVNRLLYSHLQLSQFDAAEFIYRKIFYATIATPNSTDDHLASSSEQLIHFYRSNSMLEKTTTVYLDLYEELQKRHGKTNTMVINTLYTLGDTALQINDTKDAEFAYREIYKNLAESSDLVHKDAIRACIALCNIYEQQRQYSSAQNVYSTLWHTFIKHGKDYGLQPAFAEELYQNYSRVLKQVKTDYTVLRQLAVDYRKACVRFYGVSSEITLRATLQLAKINEESDEHREDAINMYEEAYQKSKDLPRGQVSQPTLDAIQTAGKGLVHLYSNSKLSNSPRAVTLYSEELHSQQSKLGHSHRDALKWLNVLSIALSKQGNRESLQKASETLEASVFNILKNETSSQRFADSGSKIAEIYLNSGLKSDGEQLLSQLRSQAVFGFSNISKKLNLASGTKFDPSVWVFIITFGVTLGGNKDSFSSAMVDLISEFFMYEEFHKSALEKGSFLSTLVYGSRLLQFTGDIGDTNGTTIVESQLLEYFATKLNAPKTITKSILSEFLQLVLVQIHTLEPDVSILKIGGQVVNSYWDKGKFQEAHDWGYLLHQFQQFQGGYDNLEKIDLGLHVALVLAGRGNVKFQDAKTSAATSELSQNITKTIMETVRSRDIDISEVSIELLNDACGLLGDHQNLNDLEWVLSALWQARDTQPSWSTSTVVGIGRRLVETQFSQGHQNKAIGLCEDICYNLRRVWGPLDATTLDMLTLLSSFYTAAGKYRKAMLVHEDVIRDTVSDKGDELPVAEASQIAVKHVELLKRAYQRLGGWDKNPEVYVDLYQQAAHAFGSEASWKNSKPTSVEKWVPKGADSLGIWTRPENFEFMITDRKHTNYLRKSSGSWNMHENFQGPMVTQVYSSQPISTA